MYIFQTSPQNSNVSGSRSSQNEHSRSYLSKSLTGDPGDPWCFWEGWPRLTLVKIQEFYTELYKLKIVENCFLRVWFRFER